MKKLLNLNNLQVLWKLKTILNLQKILQLISQNQLYKEDKKVAALWEEKIKAPTFLYYMKKMDNNF